MRILGLPVRREHLSDEEYVERLRRNLATPRWRRLTAAAIGFLVVVVAGWAAYLFIQILAATGPNTPMQQLGVIAAFIAAILLGSTIGATLSGAVGALALALDDQRKSQLLLDCWDALHESPGSTDRAS